MIIRSDVINSTLKDQQPGKISSFTRIRRLISPLLMLRDSLLHRKKESIQKFPAKFFYIRHAQTEAHKQQLVCGGGWDIPLCEDGIRQANEAAKQYSEHLGTATVILSSPLLRAKQTADIFSKALNIPVVAIDVFQEWILGDWEKQPWDSVPNLFTRPDDPPNGETRRDFEIRVARSEKGVKSPLWKSVRYLV